MMNTLLDEILEMKIPAGHKKSCGCGCPSCSAKAAGRPAATAFLDEILYESNTGKIAAAVSYNRRNAARVGWARYRHDIVAKVLRLNYTPDEPTFAAHVADWQFDRGLTPDGKLGPATWRAMKAQLGSSPSGSTSGSLPAPAPSTGGAYAPWPCAVYKPGKAWDKCSVPGTLDCPPIPDLLCMKGVENIPFEYVHSVYKDTRTGLDRVKKGGQFRLQKFVPATRQALITFTRNMSRFGMPIHTILTLGSLYCRCVSGKQYLSNHSYGEAIDIAGVRWKRPQSISRVEDTLVRPRNLADPEQFRLIRRINACLRLSFPNVIDYHRSDHRDHFHCDLNRGGKKLPTPTIKFIQEALGLVLKTSIAIDGNMGSKTYQALSTFSGLDQASLKNESLFNQTIRKLFERIAAGSF